MKLRLFLLTSVALCYFANSASATSIHNHYAAPYPASPHLASSKLAPTKLIVPYEWGGAYFGINLGYDSIMSQYNPAPSIDSVSVPASSMGSLIFGAYAGYNSASKKGFVTGVETEFSYNKNLAREPATDNVPLTSWSGDTRVRLAYAHKQFLPYLAMGLVYSSMKEGPADLDAHTHLGWTLGSGLEYGLSKKLIGRLEYRYNNYSSHSLQAGLDSLRKGSHLLHSHDMRMGIAYKF